MAFKIDKGVDKFALFHYMNGYNTHRKDECDSEQWFQARKHVNNNQRLKDYMKKMK